MKRLTISLFAVFCVIYAEAQQIVSPNGKITVAQKGCGLVIHYQGQQVIEIPAVGFESASTPSQLTYGRTLKEDYQMLAGKRLQCSNEANEYLASLSDDIRLMVRLYNDGVAFRYELSGLSDATPEGMKRWTMQWNDAYEEYFPLQTTYKVAPLRSQYDQNAKGYACRWGYPALIEPAKDLFALISEANIEQHQSASCLCNDGELYQVTPATNDLKISGNWHTPWRVVIIGTLADIVQSTLVTDVSEPCRLTDVSWIHPGVVSWIYWANNHGSNDYNIIKKYVDMAVTLHLPYVLIDAEWDEMDKVASNEGKTIEDAVAYAIANGVKPLIWYNSSIGWVNGAPGPKYRLNKPEDREKEFAWCEKIGVAGVKVDFFSGDNQMNMDYCQDLLESAARHHLLINFHGAPIPRGWQRTYPNLLSTEGVYGAEWYNNVPHFTKKAAAHNATLPFTRNVIGPMDYTPCAFSDSQHPHITTHAHELALTVLYESGLQHLADRPESFLAQPKEVQDFLGQLPTVWDETRLLSGYPGEYAVIARRSGTTWYVAGINGTDDNKDIPLNIKGLTTNTQYLTFFDSGDSAKPWNIRALSASKIPSTITCQPRGGFVMIINK